MPLTEEKVSIDASPHDFLALGGPGKDGSGMGGSTLGLSGVDEVAAWLPFAGWIGLELPPRPKRDRPTDRPSITKLLVIRV